MRLGGGMIHTYNFNATGMLNAVALKTSGPNEPETQNFPGIEDDPVAEEFVAWIGGKSVYSLNVDTKVWTKIGSSGDDPGPVVKQGTFNRWRYVPSKNVFLILNSIDENVFAFKYKEGASAPDWYMDMLAKGATVTPILSPFGTEAHHPNLSLFSNNHGAIRFHLSGLGTAELPTLAILDSQGRSHGILAGIPIGNGTAEYSWTNRNQAKGAFFAETKVGEKTIRTRIPNP